MGAFKDLGITRTSKKFTGDKVKMSKVLNKEISILDWVIEPSDFKDKGNGMRLKLHFEMAGTKYIVFTSSTNLMEDIKKVPQSEFPLITTIIEDDDESYQFT